MVFDITSFFLGVILGVLAMASFAFPRIGCILTRLVAVVMLTMGVGLLTWAIDALFRSESLRPFGLIGVAIEQPSEAIGCGAGLVVGAIVAFSLSFVRRSD